MESAKRILKLIDILKRESDAIQPLSTDELISKLSESGIAVERKTLYKDVETLKQSGYDVITVRVKKSHAYYISESDFDVAELKILLDAVSASRFISAKKTEELTTKLAKQAGKYSGELIARTAVCFDTVKHSNEKVYFVVDSINNAISQGKKVEFKYFDFNINGEKVFRRNGNAYTVNPVALVFSDDNYYLVCYSDKYNDLANYRIDKMEDVIVLDEDITPSECVKDFKFYSHPKQSFSMFRGEIEKVTLVCDISLVTVILDKFGEKTKMTKIADDKFSICVPVQVSPTFYAWCFTFGNKMKILSPEWVAVGYKKRLKETLDET